jgi:hypothetical protein
LNNMMETWRKRGDFGHLAHEGPAYGVLLHKQIKITFCAHSHSLEKPSNTCNAHCLELHANDLFNVIIWQISFVA